MKKILLLLIALFSLHFISAQPAIQWQKCLGGTMGDYAQSIQQTFDGGYIVAGYARSTNGDVTANHGLDDFWVVKTDNAGAIEWQKCLGGSDYDQAYSIRQTLDSGYIVAGYVVSNNGDVSANHGSDDFWVVKLSSSGAIQWQKCLGGTLLDDALCIQQTSDGGYIVSGDTQSNDGDVTGNHGNFDGWIVKLSGQGIIQWQKCLGGTGDDSAASALQTTDGGYIVGGTTTSNNGDVSGNHGGFDVWVVKLDNLGIIQWQKCLGGTAREIGYAIQQSSDGNYIIAGFTESTNGDVSGMHGNGQPDYWVVKLNPTGTILWQKCLGGVNDDKGYAINVTTDGGCIVAGYSKSNEGDVSGNNSVGIHDGWLVKLSVGGSIEWQKCLGGSNIDWARSVQQTVDGGFVMAGFTASTDKDVSGNHGNNDYWMVKLAFSTTGIPEYDSRAWEIFPNPSSGFITFTSSASITNSTIKIISPLGQVVFQTQVNNEKTQLDLSAQPAGIYFVVIAGENYNAIKKIVLE